jgi:hypothetical protein
MRMSTTSRVATGVAAGYVFGRFKKLRLAVIVGSALASDKVRSTAKGYLAQRIPGGLVGRTVTTQVGSKLAEAGKTAATSAAASSIGALSDRLSARTERLRDERGDRDDDEPEDEDEDFADEYDDEVGDEDQDEDQDEDEDQDDEDDEDDRDNADDMADDDEEPVARSPRRRRSASPVRSVS